VSHLILKNGRACPKSAQQFSSLSTRWKEMLGVCSFKPNNFTNKEAYTCICECSGVQEGGGFLKNVE